MLLSQPFLFRLLALQFSLKMPKTRSQTKTTIDINRLPSEILLLILERLSIKKKFHLKAVCKKWHTFLISHILPEQRKLSIHMNFFDKGRCVDPNHQFKFRDNNSVSVLHLRANLNRKTFSEKEVTGVKVLKICRGADADRVKKYFLSEGPSSNLECFDVECLEEPLVKVLPNLEHFSTGSINLVSLISVLQYCPMLTHLSVDTTHYSNDLVNIMNFPKGLQYLKWVEMSCNLLAVFCSPAMETLESLILKSWSTPILVNIPDARVKPAPSLQRLSMSCYMEREQDQKIIVDLLKKCPALKKIDLRVTGLTLEEYVNIFSQLSNLEMIKLGLHFEFDDVIPMILERNRKSLKYLEIGKSILNIDKCLLNIESFKKLAKFTNLQTLSFRTDLPPDEQLLAFAQTRLDFSQSPLRLKSYSWNEDHLLDPLGSAFRNANIQLMPYGKHASVMD